MYCRKLVFLCHLALTVTQAQFYRNNTLPKIKYKGLLPSIIAGANRSELVTRVSFESLLPNTQSMAMIFNVEDRSVKLKNSTAKYRSVIVGYFPFNDRKFLNYFGLLLHKSMMLRLEPYRTPIRGGNSSLTYLEDRYLNRARRMFKSNMEQSRKSENRRDSLGLQIYATYPGTRRCLAGNEVVKEKERAVLRHLDLCCYKRSVCQYQSNQVYEEFATPKSADSFRRTLCECEEEFRSCLTTLKSSDADYMGDLIYNVLELQCFHPTCDGTTVKSYKQCQRGRKLAFAWEPKVKPYPIEN